MSGEWRLPKRSRVGSLASILLVQNLAKASASNAAEHAFERRLDDHEERLSKLESE